MTLPDFWRHWKSTTLRCLGADTTQLRCLCALASAIGLAILLAPDDVMARSASLYLRHIFHYDLVLAGFVGLDVALLLWRIYDPVSRPRAELYTNIYGLTLIVVISSPIIAAFGFLPYSNASVLAVAAARFWLVVRSGNGPSEVGS